MSVVLKSASESTIYTFPDNIEAPDQSLSVRVNISERSHSHGGKNIGDGKVQPRIIELSGMITAITKSALETELDKLRYFCYDVANTASRLYLSQVTSEFYIPKVLESLDVDQGRFSETCADINIVFVCEDPFRYESGAALPQTDEYTSLSGFSYRNISSAKTGTYTMPMNPVIRATLTAGAMPGIVVTNATTDKQLRFGFSSLVPNEYVEIDVDAGTCMCYGSARFNNAVGVNMIKYLVGEFFTIGPGTTTININVFGGATATVLFSWRKRWL